MEDRNHIHPLLLTLLDNLNTGWEDAKHHDWSEAGEPLLTNRSSKLLQTVETAMSYCEGCHMKNGCPDELLTGCALQPIRRAWKEKS